MDGRATDFVIDEGELVPVEHLDSIETCEFTLVVATKDPGELMQLMRAMRELFTGVLRIH